MKLTPPEKRQLTLDFEPGLIERHRHLRDCIATGIYRRGLSTVAIDLNESPGNLTNQLSDDSQRVLDKNLVKDGVKPVADPRPWWKFWKS